MPLSVKAPIVGLGKKAVRALLHEAGGLAGVRYWYRRGFRILMYHNFPSTVPGWRGTLAEQCGHINRHYNVVSLTDVGRSLREGPALPPNALAVTVDDGYRDFLEAHPIFRAHGIPVTVYLVSGFLDGKLWLWWDQLAYMLERSGRASFQAALTPGEPPTVFPLEGPEQRRRTVSSVTESLKKMTNEERTAWMVRMPALLEVALPGTPPAAAAPLEWGEVRRLVAEGVGFGAHTVTHPVLSRLSDPAEVAEEIRRSKRRIEEELRRPVLHFAYPYGRTGDFNDVSLKAVADCRFLTAVTTEVGLNLTGADPHRLKRMGAEPSIPWNYFMESLAGLHAG